jgi:hypothetical protein
MVVVTYLKALFKRKYSELYRIRGNYFIWSGYLSQIRVRIVEGKKVGIVTKMHTNV